MTNHGDPVSQNSVKYATVMLGDKAIHRLSSFAPIREGLEVLRIRADRQKQQESSQEQTQPAQE
jgi:hypothetical protein